MASGSYIPDVNRIIHQTSVDFNSRPSIFEPVHVVQYDNKLPILAVALYNNGVEYAAPSSATFNIRLSKKNRKFVSNPALGLSLDRKTVYFEITMQMVVEYGVNRPIIEMVIAGQVAGSSPIEMIIERNPVQEGDIESSDEYKSIQDYVDQASASANAAKTSENNAKKSETAAKNSETNAKSSADSASASASSASSSASSATASKNAAATSASEAADSAKAAAGSATTASQSAAAASSANESANKFATQALNSANRASASASQAESSKLASASSATAANTSANNAKASETAADKSATAASNSATAASASQTAAKASETAAKTSETNADKWAKYSESYAKGGTSTRNGEDTDNSKYYSDQAKASATAAAASAKEAEEIAGGDFVTHTEFPTLDTQGINMIRPGYVISLNDINNPNTSYLRDSSVPEGKYLHITGQAKTTGSTVGAYIHSTSTDFNIPKEFLKQGLILTCSFYAKTSNSGKQFPRIVAPNRSYKIISNDDLTITNSWKLFRITCEALEDGVYPSFTFYINTTINENIQLDISSIKIELGTVIHPIWTPAPEDLATGSSGSSGGENLLRYTKAIDKNGKFSYFLSSYGSNYIDEEGFEVIRIEANGSWRAINYLIPNISIEDLGGKDVTFSAMIKSDAISSNDNLFMLSFALMNNKTRTHEKGYYLNTDMFSNCNFVDGEWSKLIYHGTIPTKDEMHIDSNGNGLTPEYYAIQVYVSNINTSHPLEIKQAKLEYGYVENPVWAPSPADNDPYFGQINENLICMSDTSVGLMLQDGSGTIISKTYCRRTDGFIPIEPDSLYSLRISGKANKIVDAHGIYARINFYEEKSEQTNLDEYFTVYYDQLIKITQATKFTTPSNAHYAIVSFYYEDIDDFKIKFEKGPIPTPWIPNPKDYPFYISDPSPILHRNMYRGKFLGTTVSDKQKYAIQSGTFEDIFVGDYWEINDTVWRVMDIDYKLARPNVSGGATSTLHSLVLMPDTGITDYAYSTNTNVSSAAKTKVEKDFDSTMLGQYDSVSIFYPSEENVTGTNKSNAVNNIDTSTHFVSVFNRQFAGFLLNPLLIPGKPGVNWVLDVSQRYNSTDRIIVSGAGYIVRLTKEELQAYTNLKERPAVVYAPSGISQVTASDPTIVAEAMEMEPSDVGATPAPIASAPPIYELADNHRNLFRGKSLGTSFTDVQKQAIKSGSFDDLYVGDYWTLGGRIWRIVDIDYWYQKGDTNCTQHHIVVMPDNNLYNHNMNAENVTTGGYINSLMYTKGLEQAKTIVNEAFGSNYILQHRELLTNTVSNGYPSTGTWYDSTVELANEPMIYGSYIFTGRNSGTTVPYIYTNSFEQLALMRLVPRFHNIQRSWYWLRDVVSAASFAFVDGYGGASYNRASYAGGVRPVVGITGGNT